MRVLTSKSYSRIVDAKTKKVLHRFIVLLFDPTGLNRVQETEGDDFTGSDGNWGDSPLRSGQSADSSKKALII